MDIRKVKKLIELLEESGVAEIEIAEGEDSVRISRYSQHPAPVAAPAPAAVAAPVAAAPAPAAAAPAADSPAEDDGVQVTAPMVGTFYAAASPGSAPFVQAGDKVSVGDTLCILEAMKMMNQIEAEVSGVVKSVRCQNGEAVEFGQVLFVIDTSAGA